MSRYKLDYKYKDQMKNSTWQKNNPTWNKDIANKVTRDQLCFWTLYEFLESNNENIPLDSIVGHPYFWSKEYMLNFIKEFSSHCFEGPDLSTGTIQQQNSTEQLIRSKVNKYSEYLCLCKGKKWTDHLGSNLATDRVGGKSFVNITKYFRNTIEHSKSWSQEQKTAFGSGYHALKYMNHWESIFPVLGPILFLVSQPEVSYITQNDTVKSFFPKSVSFPIPNQNINRKTQNCLENFETTHTYTDSLLDAAFVTKLAPAEVFIFILNKYPNLNIGLQEIKETLLDGKKLTGKWEEKEIEKLKYFIQIKERSRLNGAGKYCGVDLGLESDANNLFKKVKKGNIFVAENVELEKEDKEKVDRIVEGLMQKTVWWEERKGQKALPNYYIERSCKRHEDVISSHGPDLVSFVMRQRMPDDVRDLVLIVEQDTIALDKLKTMVGERIPKSNFVWVNTANKNWWIYLRPSSIRRQTYIFVYGLEKLAPTVRKRSFQRIRNILEDVSPLRYKYAEKVILITKTLEKEINEEFNITSSHFLTANEDEITNLINNSIIEESSERRPNFVFLCDAPGTGKSSAFTQLESQLRTLLSRRIITRINLNVVQSILFKLDAEGISLEGIQKLLLSEIPQKALEIHCPVYILLDGMDEVTPQYEKVMMEIIETLITESKFRIVLSARPHLKAKVEQKFGVEPLTLIQIPFQNQIQFLSKKTNLSKQFISSKLKGLLPQVQNLMENPLMLSLYSEVITEDIVDLVSLYDKFLERKHIIYVEEKPLIDKADKSLEGVKCSILRDLRPFYNYIAVQDLIAFNDSAFCNEYVFEKPSDEDKLLSVGLVVKSRNDKLVFEHKTFQEYMLAKLMTDCNMHTNEYLVGEKTRNFLFAHAYEHKNMVARFVKCILSKNQSDFSFLTRNWTQNLPHDAELSTYVSYKWNKADESSFESGDSLSESDAAIPTTFLEDKLSDHIITTLFESKYKNLLVIDLYKNQLFFRWLIGQKKVAMSLMRDDKIEVLAALATSHDEDTRKFVLTKLGKEKIREQLKKCHNLIQIAIKWEYRHKIKEICTESLNEKLTEWFPNDEDVKTIGRNCFQNYGCDDIIEVIIKDFNLARFFCRYFSETEVQEIQKRFEYSYFVRRIIPRENVSLEYVLSFRFDAGPNKGKSFLHSDFADDLIDTNEFWEYLVSREGSVEKVINIMKAEENGKLIKKLENSIVRRMHRVTSKQSSESVKFVKKVIEGAKSIVYRLEEMKSDKDYTRLEHWLYSVAYWNYEPQEIIPECVLSSCQTKNTNLICKTLLWLALNSDHTKFETFVITMKNIKPKMGGTLLKVLLNSPIESFRKILHSFGLKNYDELLLSLMPSVLETVFHPEWGLAFLEANKQILLPKAFYALRDKFRSDSEVVPCCSLEMVLKGTDKFAREIGIDVSFGEELADFVWVSRVLRDWNKNRDRVICVMKAVAKLVGSWYRGLLVPLIIVLEQIRDEWAKENLKCIKSHVRQRLVDKDLYLRTFYDDEDLHYTRESDWVKLFSCFPQLNRKIKNTTKFTHTDYSNGKLCLCRTWLKIFGKKKMKDDIKSYGETKFWKSVSAEMRDDEFLRFAIEIESLEGVKLTAWPGFVKGGLEYCNEDGEIKHFLQGELDKLYPKDKSKRKRKSCDSGIGREKVKK